MIARHCFPNTFFEDLNTLFETDNLPGVNIAETDEAIFVEVPVPGCAEDKIQITYENGMLSVTAEEAEAPEPMKYLLKSSRKYAYRIPIPERIDDQVQPEASYTNGILKVVFPKSKAARPMKISVKK